MGSQREQWITPLRASQKFRPPATPTLMKLAPQGSLAEEQGSYPATYVLPRRS